MQRAERMKAQIREHGGNLARIFASPTQEYWLPDDETLARKVHRLEVAAHRLSTAWCNGQIDGEGWDRETEKILARLDRVIFFKACRVPVFVNGDARGYALKIRDEWMRAHPDVRLHKDWGGYGILAPEFDGRA